MTTCEDVGCPKCCPKTKPEPRPFKVHVEHSKTKRTIEGAFNLCADSDVLRSIATQILQQVGSAEEPRRFYGWVAVHPYLGARVSNPNTPPVAWDEFVDANRGSAKEET